jgi:hypothetical protein
MELACKEQSFHDWSYITGQVARLIHFDFYKLALLSW